MRARIGTAALIDHLVNNLVSSSHSSPKSAITGKWEALRQLDKRSKPTHRMFSDHVERLGHHVGTITKIPAEQSLSNYAEGEPHHFRTDLDGSSVRFSLRPAVEHLLR